MLFVKVEGFCAEVEEDRLGFEEEVVEVEVEEESACCALLRAANPACPTG